MSKSKAGDNLGADKKVNEEPIHPLRDYQFSDEEIRVLEECDDESFYQRCLPLSAILGGGTYMAVKQGVWKPSAIFGAAPKTTIAILVAYALGKYSYKSTCEEKFMTELPGSYVGKTFLERAAQRRLPPPPPPNDKNKKK